VFFGLSFVAWRYQSFAEPDATGNYGAPGCILLVVEIVAYFGYFVLMESNLGYTLGKGLLGLKVTTGSGGKPSAEQVWRRHLLDVIEFQLFGIPAIVAVKITRGYRLGDLWAKTSVVRDTVG
jgi:uncharacterized RDD family membrane protein YckC